MDRTAYRFLASTLSLWIVLFLLVRPNSVVLGQSSDTHLLCLDSSAPANASCDCDTPCSDVSVLAMQATKVLQKAQAPEFYLNISVTSSAQEPILLTDVTDVAAWINVTVGGYTFINIVGSAGAVMLYNGSAYDSKLIGFTDNRTADSTASVSVIGIQFHRISLCFNGIHDVEIDHAAISGEVNRAWSQPAISAFQPYNLIVTNSVFSQVDTEAFPIIFAAETDSEEDSLPTYRFDHLDFTSSNGSQTETRGAIRVCRPRTIFQDNGADCDDDISPAAYAGTTYSQVYVIVSACNFSRLTRARTGSPEVMDAIDIRGASAVTLTNLQFWNLAFARCIVAQDVGKQLQILDLLISNCHSSEYDAVFGMLRVTRLKTVTSAFFSKTSISNVKFKDNYCYGWPLISVYGECRSTTVARTGEKSDININGTTFEANINCKGFVGNAKVIDGLVAVDNQDAVGMGLFLQPCNYVGLLTRSLFKNNINSNPDSFGAALAISGQLVEVSDSQFIHNVASRGSAIYVDKLSSAETYIHDVYLAYNGVHSNSYKYSSRLSHGGSIYAGPDTQLRVERSTWVIPSTGNDVSPSNSMYFEEASDSYWEPRFSRHIAAYGEVETGNLTYVWISTEGNVQRINYVEAVDGTEGTPSQTTHYWFYLPVSENTLATIELTTNEVLIAIQYSSLTMSIIHKVSFGELELLHNETIVFTEGAILYNDMGGAGKLLSYPRRSWHQRGNPVPDCLGILISEQVIAFRPVNATSNDGSVFNISEQVFSTESSIRDLKMLDYWAVAVGCSSLLQTTVMVWRYVPENATSTYQCPYGRQPITISPGMVVPCTLYDHMTIDVAVTASPSNSTDIYLNVTVGLPDRNMIVNIPLGIPQNVSQDMPLSGRNVSLQCPHEGDDLGQAIVTYPSVGVRGPFARQLVACDSMYCYVYRNLANGITYSVPESSTAIMYTVPNRLQFSSRQFYEDKMWIEVASTEFGDVLLYFGPSAARPLLVCSADKNAMVSYHDVRDLASLSEIPLSCGDNTPTVLCPAGFSKIDGSGPCFPCARGTYRSLLNDTCVTGTPSNATDAFIPPGSATDKTLQSSFSEYVELQTEDYVPATIANDETASQADHILKLIQPLSWFFGITIAVGILGVLILDIKWEKKGQPCNSSSSNSTPASPSSPVGEDVRSLSGGGASTGGSPSSETPAEHSSSPDKASGSGSRAVSSRKKAGPPHSRSVPLVNQCSKQSPVPGGASGAQSGADAVSPECSPSSDTVDPSSQRTLPHRDSSSSPSGEGAHTDRKCKRFVNSKPGWCVLEMPVILIKCLFLKKRFLGAVFVYILLVTFYQLITYSGVSKDSFEQYTSGVYINDSYHCCTPSERPEQPAREHRFLGHSTNEFITVGRKLFSVLELWSLFATIQDSRLANYTLTLALDGYPAHGLPYELCNMKTAGKSSVLISSGCTDSSDSCTVLPSDIMFANDTGVPNVTGSCVWAFHIPTTKLSSNYQFSISLDSAWLPSDIRVVVKRSFSSGVNGTSPYSIEHRDVLYVPNGASNDAVPFGILYREWGSLRTIYSRKEWTGHSIADLTTRIWYRTLDDDIDNDAPTSFARDFVLFNHQMLTIVMDIRTDDQVGHVSWEPSVRVDVMIFYIILMMIAFINIFKMLTFWNNSDAKKKGEQDGKCKCYCVVSLVTEKCKNYWEGLKCCNCGEWGKEHDFHIRRNKGEGEHGGQDCSPTLETKKSTECSRKGDRIDRDLETSSLLEKGGT